MGLKDLFAHPEMRMMLIIWPPIVVAFLAGALLAGDAPAWLLAIAVPYGFLAWTLIEYAMHRHVFHWQPEGRFWRWLAAPLGPPHVRHHENPTSYRGAILIGQTPSLIVMGACFGLLLLAPVPTGFACMAMAAGSVGYVLFQSIHFACHMMPMRRGYWAMIKRHHAIHHYRDETVNFGLTTPLWDWVFGTLYRPAPDKARAGDAGA